MSSSLSSGLKILVVDDDVRCLRSLEDFLERDGHFIETATTGQEAVEITRRYIERERERERFQFQLSILDFHVPDMSGLETFERLSTLLPGLGAIFISGDLSDTLESSILAAGGFALFRKPLDLGRMRQAIEAYRGRL